MTIECLFPDTQSGFYFMLKSETAKCPFRLFQMPSLILPFETVTGTDTAIDEVSSLRLFMLSPLPETIFHSALSGAQQCRGLASITGDFRPKVSLSISALDPQMPMVSLCDLEKE